MEMQPASSAKDWHSSKTIRKRARYILEHPDEQIPSDITFLVGNGEKEPRKLFRCHRFILALVSSMFQAMFYGTLPPPEPEEIVEIPDVTPTAFQNLLNYAYADDDGCISVGNCLETLYCAKKYLIPKLARSCRRVLEKEIVYGSMTSDYYFSLFEQAQRIDEEEIAEILLGEIRLYTTDALQNPDFLKASPATLQLLLEQDRLSVDEPTLYQEICRWAKHNARNASTSLRESLGNLVYGIRFPLFSATQLAEGPVQDGVLLETEERDLFRFLFAKTKPTVPFVTVPRRPPVETREYCRVNFKGGPRYGDVQIRLRPDLAPACCKYLQDLVAGKHQLDFGHIPSTHSATYLPVPTSVIEERNALSHSVSGAGAVWFEWGYKHPRSGLPENVRLATWKKPALNHSAVFGYVTHVGVVFEKGFVHLDGLERLGFFEGRIKADVSVFDSADNIVG